MNAREEGGMHARTRNTYRSSIVAFCNWRVEMDRMPTSPLISPLHTRWNFACPDSGLGVD